VLLSLFLLLAGCMKHSENVSSSNVSTSGLQSASTTLSEEPTDRSDENVLVEASEPSENQTDVVLNKPLPKEKSQPKSVMIIPEISLDELVERLKKTEAIGMFTKLAIRSDVLDFKASIDDYRKKGELERYAGHLRDHFDGLLLKILTLLERDPALSKDIQHARESIWRSFLEAKS